jgi:hypothetical protein
MQNDGANPKTRLLQTIAALQAGATAQPVPDVTQSNEVVHHYLSLLFHYCVFEESWDKYMQYAIIDMFLCFQAVPWDLVYHLAVQKEASKVPLHPDGSLNVRHRGKRGHPGPTNLITRREGKPKKGLETAPEPSGGACYSYTCIKPRAHHTVPHDDTHPFLNWYSQCTV